PNAPVVQVVFELRFAGDLNVEARRHTFWTNIKRDYPKMLVPTQASALMPYQFHSDDGTNALSVGLNSFALTCRKYLGHAKFAAAFFDAFDSFQRLIHLRHLTRAGLRYVNVIPFVRDSRGEIPVSDFLSAQSPMPSDRCLNAQEVAFRLVRATGNNSAIRV